MYSFFFIIHGGQYLISKWLLVSKTYEIKLKIKNISSTLHSKHRKQEKDEKIYVLNTIYQH